MSKKIKIGSNNRTPSVIINNEMNSLPKHHLTAKFSTIDKVAIGDEFDSRILGLPYEIKGPLVVKEVLSCLTDLEKIGYETYNLLLSIPGNLLMTCILSKDELQSGDELDTSECGFPSTKLNHYKVEDVLEITPWGPQPEFNHYRVLVSLN